MGVLSRRLYQQWTPAALPGLALWLDSSDASTFTFSSGSLVSQWNDKSGFGRHFTQATVANQPSRTGTKNGLPTVSFLSSRPDVMKGTVFGPSLTALAICGVAAPTSSSTSRFYMILGTDTSLGISHSTSVGLSYGGVIGGVDWLATSLAGDTSGYSVGLVRRSGGTNTVRRNAVDLTVTNGGALTPLATSGFMWLGGDGLANVSVDVGEIIVTSGSSITGPDLTALESYANAKWAVY